MYVAKNRASRNQTKIIRTKKKSTNPQIFNYGVVEVVYYISFKRSETVRPRSFVGIKIITSQYPTASP